MPIESNHPEYAKLVKKIETVNDFLDVDAVKDAGTKYLKKSVIIENDETEARKLGLEFDPYAKFKDAAHVSSECYSTLIEALGFAFKEKPEVELPHQLEHLLGNADGAGNSLVFIFQRIVEGLLRTSRCAIAVGFQKGLAKLSLYDGQSIVNYDDIANPNLLVLAESYTIESDDKYVLEMEEQRHEIAIIDGFVVLTKHRKFKEIWRVYSTESIYLKNKEKLGFLPVSIALISEIPFYPQARELLAAYRWSAEEGHALSYLSQPQQVQVGDEPIDQPNKGSSWTLFVEKGGNIFYLELSPESLKPIRDKIKVHIDNAVSMGVKLITEGAGTQSGEALYIQSRHRQASLISVVKEAGIKLEKALRICARMQMIDDGEVIFTPDTDFIKKPIDTSKLDHLERAVKNDTAPISIYAKALVDAGYSLLTEQEFVGQLSKQREIV